MILENHITETGTGCPIWVPAGRTALCSVACAGSMGATLVLRRRVGSQTTDLRTTTIPGTWEHTHMADCVLTWECIDFAGDPVDLNITY